MTFLDVTPTFLPSTTSLDVTLSFLTTTTSIESEVGRTSWSAADLPVGSAIQLQNQNAL